MKVGREVVVSSLISSTKLLVTNFEVVGGNFEAKGFGISGENAIELAVGGGLLSVKVSSLISSLKVFVVEFEFEKFELVLFLISTKLFSELLIIEDPTVTISVVDCLLNSMIFLFELEMLSDSVEKSVISSVKFI